MSGMSSQQKSHTALRFTDLKDKLCSEYRAEICASDQITVTFYIHRLNFLLQCCIEDNLSGAELLISYGASVNVQDEDDWTPLHFACEFDNAEIVQLLLSVSKKYFQLKMLIVIAII